jgi:hypothetical protein
MPTISDGLPPFDSCDIGCQSLIDTYFIPDINISSTGVTKCSLLGR